MSNNKDKNYKIKIESNDCKSKANSLKTATTGNIKKRNKNAAELQIKEKNSKDIFLKNLETFTKDLIYISETDAEISPFIGNFANTVNSENLFSQIKVDSNSSFEEIKFEDFFRHPIKSQDWFDEERKTNARQYLLLKNLLESNLKDIRVFKVGRINLDIYIVGLDEENKLTGIKTKAIET